MLNRLTRDWWLVGLRGLAAVVFGILALVLPGMTLGALVLLFGVYSLSDGVFSLITALRRREEGQWLMPLLEGLAGIGIGLLTFIWPGITALVLLYLIAAWALVTGVTEIVAAVQLRKEIEGEWLLGLSGVASVLFGLAMVFWPGAGALALIWMIGAYAVVFGAMLVGLAWRLRNMQKTTEDTFAPSSQVQSASQ